MGYSKGEWRIKNIDAVGLYPQYVIGDTIGNIAHVNGITNAHLIAASPIGHELANAVLNMNPEDFDDLLETREIAKKFKAKVEEK